jgi:hypothetical protein
LAPSCSVWWLYWNKELTAVSEYCIKSEPSTTGPVLPLMGTPAPQILKLSGRNSVLDRVGLIHEWWLVDFFSLSKLFEDCWDRKGSSVLFEQDCKVTILHSFGSYYSPVWPASFQAMTEITQPCVHTCDSLFICQLYSLPDLLEEMDCKEDMPLTLPFALFVSLSQVIIVIWIKTSVGITTVFHTGISRAVAAA